MKEAQQKEISSSSNGISEEFIDTLKSNPNLFQKHPELLELVTLADSRGTPSLLEKQVETLKQRLSSLQSQQHDFVEVVRENEQISDSFTSIIYKLIGYKNLSEFAAEFPSALRSTFNIDEVSVKTAAGVAKRMDEKAQYDAALERLPNGVAVCDNRWPSSIIKLFFSADVASAALVPMKGSEDGPIIGLLALGSHDEHRYTHDLGTVHLSKLGHMAGICLQRLQPS